MNKYTDEQVLDGLCKALKKFSPTVSYREYSAFATEHNLPSVSVLLMRYGSWEAAKQEAIKHGNFDEDKQTTNLLEHVILSNIEQASSIIDLANRIDRSPETVKKTLDALKAKGYNIVIKDGENKVELDKCPRPFKKVNIECFYGGNVKIGVLGDTQLGSNFERLDVLNALYDLYEKEGITKVFHAGDLIDGEKIYTGHEYEVHTVGADKQAQHVVDCYPKKKDITTYFISGNHDLTYYKKMGYDIGRGFITQARSDMIYLGPEEADFALYAGDVEKRKKPAIFRMFHPGGTGSAYALSYRAQKIIESYSGGEKPSILAIGHLHKASYFFVRNVHTVQVGCCQDQTRFMRNRAIQAHIGGFIIEFNLDEKGTITRFKNEFIPFYGG
jgi:predicted phosphodiesterase